MSGYDMIVRGGRIVDGNGGEPFVGDVGVRDGIIVAVAPAIAGSAPQEIDAGGLLVTPGFVDIHTHYDGQVTWSDRIRPSSQHGVTTVVMGNCGVGFAPCKRENREALVRLMEGVEDIPEVVMTEGLPWAWESFAEYLDFVGSRAFDINVAAYLPHAPLRVHVMGERGVEREPATQGDIEAMQAVVRDALKAGALGFSTTRSINHKSIAGEPAFSFGAAERELQGIAAALREEGTGILQAITDFPDAATLPEQFGLLRRLSEQSGRPLTFTLAQFHSAPESWREVLVRLEQARADGVPMTGQVFPRPMGMLMSLNTSRNPFHGSATYQSLSGLSHAERVAQMRRPDIRAAILQEAATLAVTGSQRRFEDIYPLDSLDYEPDPDSSLLRQAERNGVSPDELAYDHLLTDDGNGFLIGAFANYRDGSLDNALRMFKSVATVPGLGDGGAHYGLICDSSYPTYLLRYWVQDRIGERLDLPYVIQSIARDTALTVGLRDRGVIAAGYRADLNLIDLDRIELLPPEMTHDLPAGGKRLTQRAKGYVATIVSGVVTYRDGEHTGALPGRLVRGARPVPEAA